VEPGMSRPVFVPLAFLLLVASLGVILQRNPVRSAFSLVVALFLLAVFYVFLEAHLVAALQVIVYAGAIMVLFLFVIMLLRLQPEPRDPERTAGRMVAGAMASLFVVQLAFFLRALSVPDRAGTAPRFGTTEAVAEALFTRLLLPFEMTSILLLVAIVGAVVLAKRKGT